MNLNRIVSSFFLFMLLAWPLALQADTTPVHGETAAIQRSVHLAVEILRDPELAKPEHWQNRRDRLRALIYGHFDFAMMSRGAVGRSWGQFSGKQKEAFIDLFRQTLEDAYLDKVESYRGKGVVFQPEQKKNQRIIILNSQVDLGGTPIRLTYRCLKTAQGWKVFDLVLEGVSVVANYRKQFQHLLKQKGVEGMLEILRGKVEDNKQSRLKAIKQAKQVEVDQP
ncbi:Tgt2/MlaC family protein [Magnetococcus sp. PR-3]|uniref:Tgt2/MlaC family protein n=1 Tax=Magnetococcus sp. PR-3 TaxID=3120355 RepID=UPI002FCE30BD